MYRFDLNADHTHFLIYDASKNDTEHMNYTLFRYRVESLFTKSLSHYRRTPLSSKS